MSGLPDPKTDYRPEALAQDSVWNRIDPLAPDLGANPAQSGLARLPYSELKGTGFERLVYELLHAENQRPWFFGRSGQAQYGIDIVTEVDGRQYVYQCKNYSEVPSWETVTDAIKKFEVEWIGHKRFPAPEEFVYCCPQPLNDNKFLCKWEKLKDDFKRRTGVALSFWDLDGIDTRLRKSPDIVAGLFSDSYAGHFCGRDNWCDDPWSRVNRGQARFLGVNRFLEKHDSKAIHVSEAHEVQFNRALENGSLVAIRGLPGVGKTFLALELACRMREPLRRIYYATLKDKAFATQLWQSARLRLNMPSLFVLDDCHLAPDAIETLIERLRPEFDREQIKLVLLLRDQTNGEDTAPSDTPGWLINLQEEQAVIDLRVDLARTLAVTLHLRPAFQGLSSARTERLHSASGGDLLLLDEILQTVRDAPEIDHIDLNKVLPNIRARYFGGNQRLSAITKLAALAQFDIPPRADFLDSFWAPDEQRLADPLMVQMFAPARYRFLHSSLAELVLRALVALDVNHGTLDDRVSLVTTGTLIEYFKFLQTASDDANDFVNTFRLWLRSKPSLASAQNSALHKSSVLADAAISSTIAKYVGNFSFSELALCVRLLSIARHPSRSLYIDIVEMRFRDMFAKSDTSPSASSAEYPSVAKAPISSLHLAMRELGNSDPSLLARLEQAIGAHQLLRLISANGTLFELFNVLQCGSPAFRSALLEELTPALAQALVDKTIASGRSIGTLNLAMRELGKADPALLTRLEQAIGAHQFLHLISANGTLFELFNVLKYGSPPFRSALLEELTPALAQALVDKTIASGRSIGTLDLAMRELGKADPTLLTRLEQVIGALQFLRLISANGTLGELILVLQHGSPAFRADLLGELAPPLVPALIDQTIANSRSIESMHYGLRSLRSTPLELTKLEKTIGAENWWRLMRACGSLNAITQITDAMSVDFCGELIAQSVKLSR